MSHSSRSESARSDQFLSVEAVSGMVLLGAAIVALIWANSDWADAYHGLLEYHVGLGHLLPGANESIHFWVNDALMAVFFLLVGFEIRRELHEGMLSGIKQAALPIAAACGGVLLPAATYCVINLHSGYGHGWAVPTATDIAFAVGVLALLGKRAPPALRVLLLAIAIVDDVLAVIVIAAFYSGGMQIDGLLIACAAVLGLIWLRTASKAFTWLRALLAIVLWGALLRAGIHPALSGVIVGLLMPLSQIRRAEPALHPWVAFGVMPLFALANAGVSFDGLSLQQDGMGHIAAGIVVSLVLGKPVGILLAVLISLRLGWCRLPSEISIKALIVAGTLAGIGFTMSIFISELAFDGTVALPVAKVAILVASGLAAVMGLVLGRVLLAQPAHVRTDAGRISR